MLNLKQNINHAIAPFEKNCAGFGFGSSCNSGYITTLKVSTGEVAAQLDISLNDIISYDRAAKNDAYFGQVNVLTATSFTGCQGAIWGYDLAVADELKHRTIEPVFTVKRHDGKDLPVYNMAPLLAATEKLFGTEKHRRFPLLPGSMCIAAQKAAISDGVSATTMFAMLALAIAEDRNKNASLFIEDCGVKHDTYEELIRKVATSIQLVGENQRVLYKEIFIGYKEISVPAGYVASTKAVAPYVLIPPAAVPEGMSPSDLTAVSIREWEELLSLR